jgi:hypothetical protein
VATLLRTRELKAGYRGQHEALSLLKSEVEYTQRLSKECTRQLVAQFEEWYQRRYGVAVLMKVPLTRVAPSPPRVRSAACTRAEAEAEAPPRPPRVAGVRGGGGCVRGGRERRRGRGGGGESGADEPSGRERVGVSQRAEGDAAPAVGQASVRHAQGSVGRAASAHVATELICGHLARVGVSAPSALSRGRRCVSYLSSGVMHRAVGL